jgi:hypothetical protein
MPTTQEDQRYRAMVRREVMDRQSDIALRKTPKHNMKVVNISKNDFQNSSPKPILQKEVQLRVPEVKAPERLNNIGSHNLTGTYDSYESYRSLRDGK